MIWSNNEQWMLTGDNNGYVKYWQSNMNNVKVYQAHNEPVRGLAYEMTIYENSAKIIYRFFPNKIFVRFSPNDSKFASCSDDSTVRIFDFYRGKEERDLRGLYELS